MKKIYVRYTRIDAKFHIVEEPDDQDQRFIPAAMCGHRWGRWPTEELANRPDPGNRWCKDCLKAEAATTSEPPR